MLGSRWIRVVLSLVSLIDGLVEMGGRGSSFWQDGGVRMWRVTNRAVRGTPYMGIWT
jgi:hypothetical protein